MKRLLIIALIALLPIRGWSAELMALAMSLPPPALQRGAEPAVAEPAAGSQASMPADCPMRGKAASGTGLEHGKGCSACQLCMPLGILDRPDIAPAPTRSHATAPWRAERYTSASLALVVKPPSSQTQQPKSVRVLRG